MPIPITEHPQYQAEQGKYLDAKNKAATEGAEVAPIEAAWQQTVNRLQNDMYDRGQAEQARAAAIVEAKALVDIPDAVLANLLTPEQIMQTARALKEQADARAPVTPPADQKPNPQAWGAGPPTGPAPSPPADPNDPKLFHDRMTGMADEIKKDAGRHPELVEQFNRDYITAFVVPGLTRKQR